MGIFGNPKVATDGFRSFSQGYFDEVFVKNIANSAFKSKANIISPPKKMFPTPKRITFVNKTEIEAEAHQAPTYL